MPVTAPSIAEFRAYFGEFGDSAVYPDDEVQKAINRACAISAVSLEALRHLIAHEIVVAKQDFAGLRTNMDGGSGEVMSEGEGPRNVSYASQHTRPEDVYFTRTSYGRTFLILESRAPSRVITVRAF